MSDLLSKSEEETTMDYSEEIADGLLIERQQARIIRLEHELEKAEELALKRGLTISRLNDAIEHTVNRLLRQTIERKMHSERNRELRQWCGELLIILRIANDDNQSGDILF